MNQRIDDHVKPLPQDSLDAVEKLHKDIETKFIEMGQLFSHIKATKLFHFNGYDSFKDWVEQEHHMSHKSANKLIRMHRLFVEEMDMDEETLKEIGFDRLMLIAPVVEKADLEKRDELIQMAEDQPLPQLYETLKKMKGEAAPDIKAVLVDQWKERMTCLFNCSWKEAQFKLALWFSGSDRTDPAVLALLKKEVRDAQNRFEMEVSNG